MALPLLIDPASLFLDGLYIPLIDLQHGAQINDG